VIAFSPDGKFLAAAVGEKYELRVWSLPDGKQIWADDKRAPVYAIAIGGDLVLSAHLDGTFLIRDLSRGSILHNWSQRGAMVVMTLSPDAKLALIGDDEGKTKLWDVANGSQLGGDVKTDSRVMAVAFSHDGKTGIVFTRSWFYLYGVDDKGLHFLKAGVLSGSERDDRFSTLDETGRRIRFIYQAGNNTLGVEDVRLDNSGPPTLTGDPKELLSQWQIKLGLQIDDAGGIKRRGTD
jgi:WD40 repeat protein